MKTAATFAVMAGVVVAATYRLPFAWTSIALAVGAIAVTVHGGRTQAAKLVPLLATLSVVAVIGIVALVTG